MNDHNMRLGERWHVDDYNEAQLRWDIRDENGLLVASVPDALREREHDAQLVAMAPRLLAEVARNYARLPPVVREMRLADPELNELVDELEAMWRSGKSGT